MSTLNVISILPCKGMEKLIIIPEEMIKLQIDVWAASSIFPALLSEDF